MTAGRDLAGDNEGAAGRRISGHGVSYFGVKSVDPNVSIQAQRKCDRKRREALSPATAG